MCGARGGAGARPFGPPRTPDTRAPLSTAARTAGNGEVPLVVGGVGRRLAKIPVDAGGAQDGARLAERDRVLGREEADSLRPLEPDLVPVEDGLVVVDPLLHELAELQALGGEAGRDVLREPARLEVARVHAHAGDHLGEGGPGGA